MQKCQVVVECDLLFGCGYRFWWTPNRAFCVIFDWTEKLSFVVCQNFNSVSRCTRPCNYYPLLQSRTTSNWDKVGSIKVDIFSKCSHPPHPPVLRVSYCMCLLWVFYVPSMSEVFHVLEVGCGGVCNRIHPKVDQYWSKNVLWSKGTCRAKVKGCVFFSNWKECVVQNQMKGMCCKTSCTWQFRTTHPLHFENTSTSSLKTQTEANVLHDILRATKHILIISGNTSTSFWKHIRRFVVQRIPFSSNTFFDRCTNFTWTIFRCTTNNRSSFDIIVPSFFFSLGHQPHTRNREKAPPCSVSISRQIQCVA